MERQAQNQYTVNTGEKLNINGELYKIIIKGGRIREMRSTEEDGQITHVLVECPKDYELGVKNDTGRDCQYIFLTIMPNIQGNMVFIPMVYYFSGYRYAEKSFFNEFYTDLRLKKISINVTDF